MYDIEVVVLRLVILICLCLRESKKEKKVNKIHN